MDFQQVRYFLELCEERNFSRAAKRCGIAQPTLSKAIQRLEASLGGALFSRGPNGAEPTALAMAVKPQLEQIAQAAQQARDNASQIIAADPT